MHVPCGRLIKTIIHGQRGSTDRTNQTQELGEIVSRHKACGGFRRGGPRPADRAPDQVLHNVAKRSLIGAIADPLVQTIGSLQIPD